MNIINRGYDPAVPIASLVAHPQNPREGDVGAICQSIEANGFYGAVVARWEKNIILAGNHRTKAALESGATTIPVIWVECTDEDAQRILLADNRTNDLASYNEPALAELLQAVREEQGTLEGTGYDDEALQELLDDLQKAQQLAPSEQDDEAPAAPVNPVSLPGDLWILGRHRVLCGDSTEATALDRLCEDVASCLWTDPPYGVKYVGKTPAQLQICGDEAANVGALVFDALTIAGGHLQPAAPFYIAHPAGGAMSLVFATAVQLAGWRVHQTIIWVKDSMVLGHSDYHYRHEPIMYGYTPGPGRPGRGNHEGSHWYGTHSETTILEIARPKRSEVHPTMKPVELIERCLNNSSRTGDSILDLFGGSGSTVIACEKTGRACRTMEIDPHYVDVIVERWQTLSGQKATLEGEGRTFADLAAERAPVSGQQAREAAAAKKEPPAKKKQPGKMKPERTK
jgi:DNA modification methylase